MIYKIFYINYDFYLLLIKIYFYLFNIKIIIFYFPNLSCNFSTIFSMEISAAQSA